MRKMNTYLFEMCQSLAKEKKFKEENGKDTKIQRYRFRQAFSLHV